MLSVGLFEVNVTSAEFTTMASTATTGKTSATGKNRNELRALVALMDDPDPFVQDKVKEQLSGLVEQDVPVLDEIREEIGDQSLRNRLTGLIHELTFPSFEQEFAELIELGLNSTKALEQSQLLLCRLDNPTLRTELYKRQLDRMAARLEPSFGAGLTAGEQLETFISFFFQKEYFKGDTKDYTSPDNSFIHKVLHRRRGIPLSLSMVMLFVARRLGMPLYGVNMPMHFLVKYESGNESTYVDPYNGGRIVSLDQCSYFLRKSGIVPRATHFERASEKEMLARTIRNLIISYEKRGNQQKVNELKRLLDYFVTG